MGGATCATQAESSAQDCNPPPVNPGGAFCCLDRGDTGSAPSDAGVGDGGSSGSCNPLTPPPVTLGTILGVGEGSPSIFYLADDAPDSGQDRVFVSNGTTLYRKFVAGSGQTGSPPNADYTFSYQDSVSDASNAHALLIQERGGVATAMALGPANSRSFLSPDAGQTPLTVVDAGTIAHFKIQNLPVLIEYVADVSDGDAIVVTMPMDPWGYSEFRLYYGTPSDMIECKIVAYNRGDTSDDIAFTVNGATYTAHLAFVSTLFSGDAGLGPSSLSMGSAGALTVTQRLPTPTTLSGFSFTCPGS